MILLIDNYDSFTFNVKHYLLELGEKVKVVRNDKITTTKVLKLNPKAIVISPGPCTPDEAGICLSTVSKLYSKIPILGICLGHQTIGQAFGSKIIKCKEIMHGKVDNIYHFGHSIFKDGNLFDPHYGKKDIESGTVKFIGNPEERIQEDYLRILRYLRFFLNYSNNKHELEIFRTIKRNIEGISKLSSERLLEEFKKLTKSDGFIKLFNDKESLELIEIIFPQLKNLQSFKKLNAYAQKNLSKIDFILLISLLIIDGTDNADYFLYKFKISNKDQKRIKFVDNFYKQKVNINYFTEKNLNKIFYFNGRQAVTDIISFKLFTSKKLEKKLFKLLDFYNNKTLPTLPVGANILMSKYNIPEGKVLGNKLKMIEEIWVQNGFQISDKQVQKIAKG